MPGFLNSCWLVLAFCAAVHCLRARGKSLPSARLRRALVLGCVLALLFPVISADDDFVQQQIASEDSSISKLPDPQKCKSLLASAPSAVMGIAVRLHPVDDADDLAPVFYRGFNSNETGDRSPPQI